MGGDHGPSVVIPAAAISLVRHPDMRFLKVGDKATIAPQLAAHPALSARSEVIHTDVAVAMDAKPSQALRKGRYHSSMWLSLEAVKANPKLANMSLVTSMRLSVQPVTADEWAEVCRMGGLDLAKLKRKPAKPRKR